MVFKRPEEPLKPWLPSLPPSSQKPPICFQVPEQARRRRLFVPAHIIDSLPSEAKIDWLNLTLIILMPPPLEVLRKLASSLLHPIPDWLPITSLKNQYQGLERKNHTSVTISRDECQQPGCYQGIGGILCSRLPHPPTPLSTSTTVSKTTTWSSWEFHTLMHERNKYFHFNSVETPCRMT